jgi:hypothetical protein
MIFDVEALLLARLAAKCAPGSLLRGTFDPIDLTDDTTTPVVAQIQIAATEPTAATGKNLRLGVVYSVNVFLDTARADAGEKAAAATLFEDALAALVDYEYQPGRHVEIVGGKTTEFDGRVLAPGLRPHLPGACRRHLKSA